MKSNLLVICFLLSFGIGSPVFGEILGNGPLPDDRNKKLKAVDSHTIDDEELPRWLTDPQPLSLNMLIPVYGSYVLDNAVDGNIRPPAYVFDWSLGGFIPLGLILTANLAGDVISDERKRGMVSAAVGLYLLTRVGVFMVINDQIDHFNNYVRVRLEMIAEETAGINVKIGLESEY